MIAPALPLVLAMGAALVVLEHLFPAHPIRPDVRWYVRATAINALQVLVYLGVEHAWSRWALPSLGLVGHRLPALASAVLAYVIFTFVVYWWHRARHASPLIWRLLHQFHHSPTRIQTLTAYYIHPLDMLVVLTISNLILCSTRISACRARWATSFRPRKCIARTTRPAITRRTTPTSSGGTCSSAPCESPGPDRHVRIRRTHGARHRPDARGRRSVPRPVNLMPPTAIDRKEIAMPQTSTFVNHHPRELCFRTYANFDDLAADGAMMDALIEQYQLVFGESEVWGETYSRDDVLAKLRDELAGEASLRVCHDRSGKALGFCWAQLLGAASVMRAVDAGGSPSIRCRTA